MKVFNNSVNLLNNKHLCDTAEKLEKAEMVLQSSAIMNVVGAGLIISGLSTSFIYSKIEMRNMEPSLRLKYAIFAYSPIVTGLALLIFSTYRLNGAAT